MLFLYYIKLQVLKGYMCFKRAVNIYVLIMH